MMRNILILVASIFLAASGLSAAESFAPVPPGGKPLMPADSDTVNLLYRDVALQEIVSFYENELKDKDNINWKKTRDSRGIVIHDWGNREWHKIVVDTAENGVQITINRDSWTWIIGTLVIRFVGVFTVLVILMIALYISGFIMTLKFVKTDNE